MPAEPHGVSGGVLARYGGGIGYGEARLTVTDNGRGIRNPSEHGSG
jgi:two-component system, sensor histidine kinase PdtaS